MNISDKINIDKNKIHEPYDRLLAQERVSGSLAAKRRLCFKVRDKVNDFQRKKTET